MRRKLYLSSLRQHPPVFQRAHNHAYGHEMTIYGEPSPALAELVEKLAGHVTFSRYSLLQGLDRDIPVPHEVPA